MLKIGQKIHIDSTFGPIPAVITQLEPLFVLVKLDSGASDHKVLYTDILESPKFPVNPLSQLITTPQGTLWVTIGDEVILGDFDLVKIKSFGSSTFVDENGKYHLYSSVACKKLVEIPNNVQEMTKQTKEPDNNLAISKTGSMRFNGGKPQTSEISPDFLLEMGQVLEAARKKYPRANWVKGANYSVPYDSLMRHILAWQKGEKLDKESGRSHLAHAALNLMMLHYYENNFPEMDDRIFKEKK